MAAIMAITVPNLRTLSERNQGVFPADAVAGFIDGRDLPVSHGIRTMPVWGEVFDATTQLVPGAQSSGSRVDAIINYLRELQYRQ